MTQMTWLQGANAALDEEMARDERVFVMGEDVQAATFGLTAGLADKYGNERVRNTPIVEETIIGSAVGAAMLGLRPFVDLNIATFSYTAFDQIVNQVAKNRFLFGAQASLPMVIYLNEFHRSHTAAQHTDRPHGLFMAMPGLTILAPGDAADSKAMIKAAIRSDDPVMVFSDQTTWNRKADVPDGDVMAEIGPVRTLREGKDVTIVTMFSRVMGIAAAAELEKEGIDAELIELTTLAPLDEEGIVASVNRTGRLVVVDQAHQTAGAAAEIAAIAADRCFHSLKAPVARVCTPDIHIPFAPALEPALFPDKAKIVAAVHRVLEPAKV
jgi:acetoin:2,6-dichlorophenolindophenol oxidoreductase subunit beta